MVEVERPATGTPRTHDHEKNAEQPLNHRYRIEKCRLQVYDGYGDPPGVSQSKVSPSGEPLVSNLSLIESMRIGGELLQDHLELADHVFDHSLRTGRASMVFCSRRTSSAQTRPLGKNDGSDDK